MSFEAGTVYARIGGILDSSFNRVFDQATAKVDDTFAKVDRATRRSLNTLGGLTARQGRLNKILDKAQIGSKRYRDIAKELGRVNAKLAGAKRQAQGFGQTLNREAGLGKTALTGMALGGWGAVIDQGIRAGRVAVEFGKDLIDASNRAQNATLALATVVRTKLGEEAIATAEAEAQRLEKALKGAMDPASIQAALKNLVAANFTIEESGRLIEANAKIASTSRQRHLGLAESVVVYTDGIKNGLSTLTDATGISENLSTTLKRQGFTMDDLSDATRGAEARQVLLNKHLAEATPFAEAFNQQMESYHGHVARSDAATEKLSVTFGDFLKERLEPTAKSWADFLETLSEDITVDSLDEVYQSLELVLEPLGEIQSSTFEIWQLFAELAQEILGAGNGTDALRTVFKLLARAINLALTPIRAIHAVIKLILGIANSLVRLFRGDFSGALDAARRAFGRFADNIRHMISKIKNAFLSIFEQPRRRGGATASFTLPGDDKPAPTASSESTGGSGDKIKPTFRFDDALRELEAAINLLEQGHQVRIDLRTVNGGDLFEELKKAGLSEESAAVLQRQMRLDVEVINESEIKELSNFSDVSGSTGRNLDRARNGEGPAPGTLRSTASSIETDDAGAAQALRELKEVLKSSQAAQDSLVELNAKAGEASGETSNLVQKITQALNLISDLAGRVSEVIQNSLRLQLQAIENSMALLNFLGDLYLADFNQRKEEEIRAFREAEDRKLEIMREAVNDRLALIDAEFDAIRQRLEEELALKIQQLEAEHLAQIDFIEVNSADHAQELILKELQDEEFRQRKEGLEREHEERLTEELQIANEKKEAEKKKSNKAIQKAEAAKNKELARMEQQRAEEERKIKKQMATLQWLHDLAGWNLEKQIAKTQVQFATAQAVMGAVASSLALPFPFNLVVMGLTTGLAITAGAQQMALIEGQMPPLPPVELFFREGGLVPGPALPEDSISARLTGGEFVVNRAATSRHLELLEAINDDVGGRSFSTGSGLAGLDSFATSRPATVVLEEGAIKAVIELRDEELEVFARGVTEKQGAIIHSAAF